jgi:hypothetical protein
MSVYSKMMFIMESKVNTKIIPDNLKHEKQ